MAVYEGKVHWRINLISLDIIYGIWLCIYITTQNGEVLQHCDSLYIPLSVLTLINYLWKKNLWTVLPRESDRFILIYPVQFSRSVVSGSSLSIINSQSILKLMSIESVIPSNHLILCHPLLLLPSILPSIRVFSNESVLRIEWPEYWSFSFNISPSSEYSGLVSFRMD